MKDTAQPTKKCFKCGEGKPLNLFYKHPQMKDGHVNKCKDCNKLDVRDNRRKRIDYYRAYDRERGNRQSLEYLKKYKESNPIKCGARALVGNAIRCGKLKRPAACSECGASGKIHGHHDDYAKPLDVRWLCPGCHFQWHAKHGEGLNG